MELSTLRLSKADCVGGEVAPNEGPKGPHSVITDAGTPSGLGPCACHDEESDGFDDLSLKFESQDVVSALELNDLPGGMRGRHSW